MKTFKPVGYIFFIALLMTTLLSSCSSESTNTKNNVEVASHVELENNIEKETYEDNSYLVNTDYLLENLSNDKVLILDVRGDEAYAKAHIPGAISISWPDFSNVNGAPGDLGWGLLLDKETLSEKLSAIGVDDTKTIVVYADTEKGWGEDGRIVWMLRMAGIENSKILDGGINLWASKDLDISKDETLPVATDFKIENLNEKLTITTEELTSRMGEFTIIDTREENEFDGDVKYGEKRGGHLPNARLLTFNTVLNKDGTFKSASELTSIFSSVGLDKEDEIVTYCTAGIRSAHLQIALNMMGYKNVRNYDASFYEYAANESLPLESKIIVKGDYKYYSAEQLKSSIESNLPFVLLDIQVEEEFSLHNIKGSQATHAYPVKSDDDKTKLDAVLSTLEETNNRIVIVCPKGGGGAERTVNYLLDKGIDKDRLFILENGQAGWPFDELLKQ